VGRELKLFCLTYALIRRDYLEKVTSLVKYNGSGLRTSLLTQMHRSAQNSSLTNPLDSLTCVFRSI